MIQKSEDILYFLAIIDAKHSKYGKFLEIDAKTNKNGHFPRDWCNKSLKECSLTHIALRRCND